MQIIQRYILKEFFTYFGLVQAVVITIFVTIDYLTRIGQFMKAGMPLLHGLGYILLKVPFIINLLMPACAILAAIVIFSLMEKNNEVIALKSSGVKLTALLKPVIFLGLGLTMIFFLLSETIVPHAQSRANDIRRKIRHQRVTTTRDNNIWIKRDALIIHINFYNHLEKKLSGITLYYFNPAFHLVKRIDAQTATFHQSNWILKDVLELHPDKENRFFVSRSLKEKKIHLDLKPEDLKSVIKESEEMSIREIYRYVRKIIAEGYDPIFYLVDLHGKLAFPFACLLMCILGYGVVLSGKRRRGLPVNIAIGICISFAYWFFHSFCISLGYGEMLPPVIAAWMANFILLCSGGFILTHVE